jgi:16S rRNA (guanine(966)-N(2))-methyltransferase RsmD
MRESMFSILGDLNGLSFLDLFSGSGLVGLEAWSRGAGPVLLVEKDRGKKRDILKNIADLSPAPTLRIEPVERFVARNHTAFDVIYLDPPFAYRFKADLLSRIAVSPSVHDRSRILLHAPRQEQFSQESTGLTVEDRRDYGGSSVTFFRAPQT